MALNWRKALNKFKDIALPMVGNMLMPGVGGIVGGALAGATGRGKPKASNIIGGAGSAALQQYGGKALGRMFTGAGGAGGVNVPTPNIGLAGANRIIQPNVPNVIGGMTAVGDAASNLTQGGGSNLLSSLFTGARDFATSDLGKEVIKGTVQGVAGLSSAGKQRRFEEKESERERQAQMDRLIKQQELEREALAARRAQEEATLAQRQREFDEEMRVRELERQDQLARRQREEELERQRRAGGSAVLSPMFADLWRQGG